MVVAIFNVGILADILRVFSNHILQGKNSGAARTIIGGRIFIYVRSA